MSSPDKHTIRVSSRAALCSKHFNYLCTVGSLESWAEDQRARFNIWAASLGVFASGHASIDHRLRDNRSAVQLIVQLLNGVDANLLQLVDLCKKASVVLIDPTTEDAGKLHSNVERLLEKTEARDFDENNSSGSSSSSFSIPSLESSNDGGDNSTISEFARVTSECRADVEAGITRLGSISRSIRLKGNRYRDKRAEEFVDKDVDGNDITQLFQLYISTLIDRKYPDTSKPIRERIAHSIAQRRNRIAYRRRHHQKLTVKDPDLNNEDENFPPAETEISLNRNPTPSTLSPEPKTPPSLMTATSATKTWIGNIFEETFSSRGSSRASTVISGKSLRTRGLKIPHAPEPSQFKGRPEFLCPYCFIVYPIRESQGERWRQHVMNDLVPYICLFEDCPGKTDCFRSFNDWVLHMKQEHKERQWMCLSPTHEPLLFRAENLYISHMFQDHAGTFAPSEITSLAQMRIGSISEDLQGCPFWPRCEDDDERLNPASMTCVPKDELHKHLKWHLQSLALLSLQWLDENESVDPIEGSAAERLTEHGTIAEPISEFDDPPDYEFLELADTIERDLSKPQQEPLGPDPAWINMDSPDYTTSREDEWGFHWKTSLPLYEGHEKDEKLKSFIHRWYNNKQGIIGTKTLQSQLWDTRIEWPKGQGHYFIPANDRNRLINVESIVIELERCMVNSMTKENYLKTAEWISAHAATLFAILVYIGKSECILDFLDENFRLSDKDLPFVRSEIKENNLEIGNFKLRARRSPDEPIKCMETWERNSITTFDHDQWLFLSPIFKWREVQERPRHWEIEDHCTLPFIEDKEIDATGGVHRPVRVVRVHPAHQLFYESKNSKLPNPLLALKRLKSTQRKDFDIVLEKLRELSSHMHPHLIKLLATLHHKGRYYLMYPYADLNLWGYWERTPLPEFSETTLRWALIQCKGIASGLMALHEYRTPYEKNTEIDGDNAYAPPEDSEWWYGRHGDIMPESILWLEQNDEDNPQGLLVLNYFGLLEFHAKFTKSRVPPEHYIGSPTYEPPECRLKNPVTRAIDIWCLGCVYLEFITWLVLGWDVLFRFTDARLQKGGVTDEITDDAFYTILGERSADSNQAIVRENVIEWIKDLHEQPRCSKFIHDVLDLIQKNMLIVDPSQRIRCGHLNAILGEMLDKSIIDPSYLTKPAPRQPRERNEIAKEITERLAGRSQDIPLVMLLPKKGSTLPLRESPGVIEGLSTPLASGSSSVSQHENANRENATQQQIAEQKFAQKMNDGAWKSASSAASDKIQ